LSNIDYVLFPVTGGYEVTKGRSRPEENRARYNNVRGGWVWVSEECGYAK